MDATVVPGEGEMLVVVVGGSSAYAAAKQQIPLMASMQCNNLMLLLWRG